MSGRAVSGGVAAGCGAFTFVGLLLGVGLTVFLGSRATDSLGGSGSNGKTGLDHLTSEVSSLVASTQPGGPATGARLVLSTPAKLGDGGSIGVAGQALAPGEAQLTTCLTIREPYPADGGGQCDLDTTAPAGTVDQRGEVTTTYRARRVITVHGTRYDCAARAGACSLVAHPVGRLDGGAASIIVFGNALPPTDAQAPPIS